MNIHIPTVSDLHRAAAGAAVGARLALGPERWSALRAAWRVLAIFGWAVFAVYLVIAVAVLVGGVT